MFKYPNTNKPYDSVKQLIKLRLKIKYKQAFVIMARLITNIPKSNGLGCMILFYLVIKKGCNMTKYCSTISSLQIIVTLFYKE